MRPVLFIAVFLCSIGSASAADALTWHSLGPPEAGGFVAVDHRDAVVVAVDERGAVWRSPDGGLAWQKTLRAPRGGGQSNRDLLQLEGAIEEIGSDDSDVVEASGDEVDEETEVPTVEAIDEDLVDVLGFLGEGGGGRGGSTALVVWGEGDQLMVSRSDGLHLSVDGGSQWQKVGEQTALAIAPSKNGWVVARWDGLYETDELGRFGHVFGTEQVGILDLATADGVTWAATTEGLWSNSEGIWAPTGSSSELISTLLVDPGWEGGLWVISGQQVLRTDDGGVQWTAVDTPFIPSNLYWLSPGEWAITDQNGGFATASGGQWSTAQTPTSGALHAVDGQWIAVGPEGFFHSGLSRALSNSFAPWISLNDLVHSSLSRSELTASADASRLVRSLMPSLTTEYKYSPFQSTDFNKVTTVTTKGEWQLGMTLKWTPAGRESSQSGAVEAALDELALRADYDGLGAGGDRSLLGAMGNRVSRSVAEQRNAIAFDLVGLYKAHVGTERAILAQEGKAVDEAVYLALRKLELEAKMDALTNGAVSAWNQNLE
ncbi:MAG: hypothetical protein GWP91_05750 [Rhodobacterales bacterium]|nr:hypothetical protein [Rhodobacterales bacterium]